MLFGVHQARFPLGTSFAVRQTSLKRTETIGFSPFLFFWGGDYEQVIVLFFFEDEDFKRIDLFAVFVHLKVQVCSV